MNDIWFQKDCVTFKTCHATIDLLQQTFDVSGHQMVEMIMSIGRQEAAIR